MNRGEGVNDELRGTQPGIWGYLNEGNTERWPGFIQLGSF